MVVFALSCFGLLLFLWLAFGGPIPLKPKGYRVSASFAEAGIRYIADWVIDDEPCEIETAHGRVGRGRAGRPGGYSYQPRPALRRVIPGRLSSQ